MAVLSVFEGVIGSARAQEKSRLDLPTDGVLYDKVRGRTLTTPDLGPMDGVMDYTLVECLRWHEGRRQVLLGLKLRGFGQCRNHV